MSGRTKRQCDRALIVPSWPTTRTTSSAAFAAATAAGMPGMITLTQPKVPEAKIRGSQQGFQWVILGLERVQGVLDGVPRGPAGPPRPLGLAALRDARHVVRGDGRHAHDRVRRGRVLRRGRREDPEDGPSTAERARSSARAPTRREFWGLFFVCCLYSVDVKICKGSLSRDTGGPPPRSRRPRRTTAWRPPGRRTASARRSRCRWPG